VATDDAYLMPHWQRRSIPRPHKGVRVRVRVRVRAKTKVRVGVRARLG